MSRLVVDDELFESMCRDVCIYDKTIRRCMAQRELIAASIAKVLEPETVAESGPFRVDIVAGEVFVRRVVGP